jgi:hypothetical protein
MSLHYHPIDSRRRIKSFENAAEVVEAKGCQHRA